MSSSYKFSRNYFPPVKERLKNEFREKDLDSIELEMHLAYMKGYEQGQDDIKEFIVDRLITTVNDA